MCVGAMVVECRLYVVCVNWGGGCTLVECMSVLMMVIKKIIIFGCSKDLFSMVRCIFERDKLGSCMYVVVCFCISEEFVLVMCESSCVGSFCVWFRLRQFGSVTKIQSIGL